MIHIVIFPCSFTVGPIVTHIKALLVPAPLKEIRVKGDYLRLQEVKASMGIRISAANLEQTIAGTSMLVCGPRDNEDMLMVRLRGENYVAKLAHSKSM